MTTHTMKLAKEPFDKIVSGQKIIESRLFDEKRQLINIGDEIEFEQSDNPNQTVKTRVVALYRYASFDAFFRIFRRHILAVHPKSFLSRKSVSFIRKKNRRNTVWWELKLSCRNS